MRQRLPSRLALVSLLAVTACGGDESADPADLGQDTGSDALLPDTEPGDTSADANPNDAAGDAATDTAEPDTIADTADADVSTDAADAADAADAVTDTSELPEEPTELTVTASEGGSVEHAGSELVVPGGALADDTTLTVDARIEEVEGLEVVGAVYDFGPDGTEFDLPVLVSLPIGAADPSTVRIWWTNRAGEFEPVPTFVEGDRALTYVDHFSQGVVVTCAGLTCTNVDPVCLDATNLQVSVTSCRNGACVGETSTVDCSVSLPNRAGSCGAGACAPGACNAGYSDCDGSAANGCEIFGSCAVCGDGVVQAGEGCDDGNTTSGDGCSATCLAESCTPATETCDGVDNDCDGDVDEGCAVCGDGIVDGAEECDDGNANNGDGCEADCTITPVTCIDSDGDNYGVGCAAGPDCDDTNGAVFPGATDICNGIDDDCDSAIDEDISSDPCSTGLAGICADGVTVCISGIVLCEGASPTPELCGNGLDDDCDGVVDNACSFCGDGIVDATEQCDDGNLVAGDGCEPDCTLTP